MCPGECFLQLFQLKTRECSSVSPLLPFCGIFMLQFSIIMVRHWAVTTAMCCLGSVLLGTVLWRLANVRNSLQFQIFWYAHNRHIYVKRQICWKKIWLSIWIFLKNCITNVERFGGLYIKYTFLKGPMVKSCSIIINYRNAKQFMKRNEFWTKNL